MNRQPDLIEQLFQQSKIKHQFHEERFLDIQEVRKNVRSSFQGLLQKNLHKMSLRELSSSGGLPNVLWDQLHSQQTETNQGSTFIQKSSKNYAIIETKDSIKIDNSARMDNSPKISLQSTASGKKPKSIIPLLGIFSIPNNNLRLSISPKNSLGVTNHESMVTFTSKDIANNTRINTVINSVPSFLSPSNHRTLSEIKDIYKKSLGRNNNSSNSMNYSSYNILPIVANSTISNSKLSSNMKNLEISGEFSKPPEISISPESPNKQRMKIYQSTKTLSTTDRSSILKTKYDKPKIKTYFNSNFDHGECPPKRNIVEHLEAKINVIKAQGGRFNSTLQSKDKLKIFPLKSSAVGQRQIFGKRKNASIANSKVEEAKNFFKQVISQFANYTPEQEILRPYEIDQLVQQIKKKRSKTLQNNDSIINNGSRRASTPEPAYSNIEFFGEDMQNSRFSNRQSIDLDSIKSGIGIGLSKHRKSNSVQSLDSIQKSQSIRVVGCQLSPSEKVKPKNLEPQQKSRSLNIQKKPKFTITQMKSIRNNSEPQSGMLSSLSGVLKTEKFEMKSIASRSPNNFSKSLQTMPDKHNTYNMNSELGSPFNDRFVNKPLSLSGVKIIRPEESSQEMFGIRTGTANKTKKKIENLAFPQNFRPYCRTVINSKHNQFRVQPIRPFLKLQFYSSSVSK